MSASRSRRLAIALAGGGALALVLLYLLFGRGSPRFGGATADASILLVTCDALRADRLGAYGARDAATPVIDTLADEGVLFEAAYAPAVLTQPAHASILTGTWPAAHGVRADLSGALPAGALTLAEVLRARGVKTGAVVASFLMDSRFGMDQGFEWYDDALPAQRPEDSYDAERPASAVTTAALRFLRQAGGGRFFLWVHYADPGRPWSAPADWQQQFPGRGYDAEIAYTDAEIGRLLAALKQTGLRDRTLIALVGAHGEGLGDHGEQGHGVFVYDEAARVPLILSFPPHLPAGRRVRGLASAVDVMPTLLDLVRINPAEAAAPVQGGSLWPQIADTKDRLPGRPVFTEALLPQTAYGWSPLAALRDNGMLFIDGPRPELYDLRADPGQRTDLAGSQAPVVAVMKGNLGQLGQGATVGVAATPAGGIDPRDRLAELAAIERVADLHALRQDEAVIGAARQILAAEPSLLPVRRLLAGSLARTRRYPEALSEYGQILQAAPDDTLTVNQIGWCLYNQQRLDEAAAAFQRVLEKSPDDVQAATSLGDVAIVKGDAREASRQYIAALKIEPNYLPAIMAMGKILEGRSDFEKAAVVYAHAAEVDPDSLQAWLNLGWARLQLNKPEEAIEALTSAEQAHPAAPEIQLALGDLYYQTGRLQEAEAAYQKTIAAAPGAANAYYGLGMTALKRGDARGALQQLRRAVAMRPDKAAWREDLRAAEGAARAQPQPR